MAFLPRKFAYRHPTFGRTTQQRTGSPFRNSVYFYWWTFLRMNEQYKRCCEQGGKGKLAQLYADFGDVHASDDFKKWWQENERGASLFAEGTLPTFKVVGAADELVESPRVLYVQVPLDLPKRFLTREFQAVLDKHHTGRRGVRTNASSTARYPVSGHVDLLALDKCLRAMEIRASNPNMPLWEVAQSTKAMKPECLLKSSDAPGGVIDKKRVLAVTASRLLARGRRLVEATAQGKFPVP